MRPPGGLCYPPVELHPEKGSGSLKRTRPRAPERGLITGYNTDIEHDGRIFHIQTEDKGRSNPIIESLIYVGGEILASRRTPYADLLESGLDEKLISEKMEAQHHRMIMDIRQGKYDPGGVKPFGAGIISDRSFEEVVLDYLETELQSDRLQVEVDSPREFVEGDPAVLALQARGELSSLPVGDVQVVVEFITTADKPRVLAEGKTDAAGGLRIPLAIPALEEGNAAVVVRAVVSGETVELKWLVRKAADRR